MTSFLSWIKKNEQVLVNNKLELLVLVLILSLAIFLRFYRLSEYMTFLGDEGRDALMIKRILTTYDFPLVGPPTSVGNMYLGPLYYYMISVPMAIFWLDPVAAAGMVALIGVASVALICYLCREWFGKTAALLAAFLYTTSFVTVTYSRSSWNPNPAPFFSLLAILGLYLAKKNQNYLWLTLSGASLAFVVQMHYLALLMIPVVFFLWLYELIYNKVAKHNFWLGTILAAISFLFLVSPLVIFDFKYNFVNYRAITQIFGSGGGVELNLLDRFQKIIPLYTENLIQRYLAGNERILSIFLSIVLFLPLCFYFLFRKTQKEGGWPFIVLVIWLAVGLLGLSLYRFSVYDHYLGFLSPAAFLLFGYLIYSIESWVKIPQRHFLLGGCFLLMGVLLWFNIQKNPLNFPPNNQLRRTQEISKFVISESGGKPFNFALLAERNYDAAYQFFLDIYGYKPKQVPAEITDQLFVVCEDPICQPINHPKYEIAAFGWAKIESEKSFSGVRVFKIVHNPSGTP